MIWLNWPDFICGAARWSAPSPNSRGFQVRSPAGSVCVESACSPRVCVGSLRVLRVPPTVQTHAVRLTGDSELSLGVSVCGRLSLCGPVMDWRPVQGDPASRPMTAGIGSSPPATRPTDYVGIENGWMSLQACLNCVKVVKPPTLIMNLLFGNYNKQKSSVWVIQSKVINILLVEGQ